MTPSEPDYKIVCHNLQKIFGPRPATVPSLMARGLTRDEVLAKTGHVIAVHNVSLKIERGEIFVVMGLSGSGKSTLIRCLTRLIEPTSGQILIDGVDVMSMDKNELRQLRRHKVSMVFQRFGLFPHRRVIENVAYGLEVQGIDKPVRLQQAAQVLRLVGLQGWERKYPHELSGGMQQRVGLARALAVNPDILLCDEPFSALDPLIRREMQDELIRLQEMMHKTVVFITHDFLEAIKLGDHIAIMKDGEIVQVGTPQEIVSQPANEYVRAFTKDVPRAKVLTAGTIMHQQETMSAASSVPHDTTLEALIPLVASHDMPVAVTDDNNQRVGFVDRTAVMLAMAT